MGAAAPAEDTTANTWRTIPATTTLAENLDPPTGGRRTRATPPAAAPGPATASPARAAEEAAAARAASPAAGVAAAREARAAAEATTTTTPAPRATTTTTKRDRHPVPARSPSGGLTVVRPVSRSLRASAGRIHGALFGMNYDKQEQRLVMCLCYNTY